MGGLRVKFGRGITTGPTASFWSDPPTVHFLHLPTNPSIHRNLWTAQFNYASWTTQTAFWTAQNWLDWSLKMTYICAAGVVSRNAAQCYKLMIRYDIALDSETVFRVKVRESRAKARSSNRCESFTEPVTRTTTDAVSSSLSIRISSWLWVLWSAPWTLCASLTGTRPTRSASTFELVCVDCFIFENYICSIATLN